jgi:3-deoxy-D-manno-octulosonic-acid transferase
LSLFFYTIFLSFFKLGAWLAVPFNSKAKKWVHGRRQIFQRLETALPKGEKIIWMHCASLGEFEQGRPLIEKLKTQNPGYRILLTFFSPSGYEVQKNYSQADWVYYLPVDGPLNAKRFIQTVNPSLVIFVKYEFWYYYLKECNKKDIPLLLISGIFRKEQYFFKWYGFIAKKMLRYFTHLFVQDENSKQLLKNIAVSNVTVNGDTRFDRVIEITSRFEPISAIEQFIGNSKTIVAGSTWPEDEEVLQKAFAAISDRSFKLIIAPHEISEKHLGEIKKLFPPAILFTGLITSNPPAGQQAATSNILIIDNMGMLSRLYHYAYITYVGGGLTKKGLHNTLEAAVFGKPVIIGPHYEKYIEAVELIKNGGAFVIENEFSFIDCITALSANHSGLYERTCKISGEYVRKNAGATQKIIQFIQEKRLLTN